MITRFWSVGRRHPYWSTGVLAQGPVVLSNMPWEWSSLKGESPVAVSRGGESSYVEGWSSVRKETRGRWRSVGGAGERVAWGFGVENDD